MDAVTLYVVLQMANGEFRTAIKAEQPTLRACRDVQSWLPLGQYFQRGAKLVMTTCTYYPKSAKADRTP